MSNTIQIKRGKNPPTINDLSDYELGYSTSDKNLYIKDSSSDTSVIRTIGEDLHIIQNYIMYAKDWKKIDELYVYDFENIYPAENNDLIIVPNIEMTSEQLEYYYKYEMMGSSKSNKIIAFGNTSKLIDLPIMLIIRRK